MKVSGTKPNTLKLTQKSVVCVRQTISLSTASTKKEQRPAHGQLAPAFLGQMEHRIEHDASSGLPNASPPSSVPPNSR